MNSKEIICLRCMLCSLKTEAANTSKLNLCISETSHVSQSHSRVFFSWSNILKPLIQVMQSLFYLFFSFNGSFGGMWAPVSLCLVPVKFEQQPVPWCQGLSGVRAGIIEQRVADRGSWHWDQTDVAIIKKYTTSELNIKSPGSEKGRHCELSLLFV